ncbi:MAG TPA: hypothetical protein VG435_11765 [Acidimicrobiales bacterium]|jgi:hypothetical protein|nr:hypothetical protein [Acidimicrobiales bacterium]
MENRNASGGDEERPSAPSREEHEGAADEAEAAAETIEPAPGAPMQRGENR